MKRIFLLTLATAVAGFATVANAATLTIAADATTYAPGATITLTVTGTIDPTAEFASNIDVRLDLTNATFVSSTADQALNPPPAFGPQTGWTVGGTEGTASGNSVTVFGQIQGLPPGGPFVNNYNGTDAFITATVVATAGSPGTAEFDFGSLTNFFGVGGGAGTTVNVVPEPTTAALMGLGLLGLAAAGRRR